MTPEICEQMPYKYIEDISLADVCFVAEAKTLLKLLEECGLATTNVMVKDLKSVKRKGKKTIKVEGENPEFLISKFIGEIIFHKDADLLLFSKYTVKIEEPNAKHRTYKLTCKAEGEKLDMKKHELLVDVKAFTWHLFEVKHDKSGWKTRVILDI